MNTRDNDTADKGQESDSLAVAPPQWEWAFVEVMGHRSHVGRVCEEVKFGAKLLRVDVPIFEGWSQDPGADKPNDQKLLRYETHYYSGAAIFSLTITNESSVMTLAKRSAGREPAQPALLPSRMASDTTDYYGADDED